MASTIKTALITVGTNSIGEGIAYSIYRKGINGTIGGQINAPIFTVFILLGAKLFTRNLGTELKQALSGYVPRNGWCFWKYFSNSIAIKSSLLSYDNTISSRFWQTSLKMIAN